MLILIFGLVCFFSLHSLAIIAPRWRERKRHHFGIMSWRLIISFGSLLSIGLISWGLFISRQTPAILYIPPAWTKPITDVLMLAVFPMLYATFLPCRIRSTLKYPDLVAIKLWALAHLIANGMLHEVILFGSFMAWAVLNRISLKRRIRLLPLGARSEFNDLVCIIAGIVTYLIILFFLHYRILGVIPV